MIQRCSNVARVNQFLDSFLAKSKIDNTDYLSRTHVTPNPDHEFHIITRSASTTRQMYDTRQLRNARTNTIRSRITGRQESSHPTNFRRKTKEICPRKLFEDFFKCFLHPSRSTFRLSTPFFDFFFHEETSYSSFFYYFFRTKLGSYINCS